jgi:hypothetical protein
MSRSKLVLVLSMVFFFLSASALQAQTANQYIGADKCKICHNKPATGAQYTVWASSKHSQAMKSLNAEQAKDPKCTKCHSTYASVDAGLISTLTLEEGVSCESCHGPGSAYKSMGNMTNPAAGAKVGLISVPDEAVCKKCHNAESPNFKGFDYATYKAKISHPNPNK